MAVIDNGYIEPTEGLWVSPCGSFGGGETKKGVENVLLFNRIRAAGVSSYLLPATLDG